MKKPLRILHLYPQEMNASGDSGNLLTLRKRCEWRNIPIEIIPFESDDSFRKIETADIIFGGGSQDSGQATIEESLRAISPTLRTKVESGTPILVTSGFYQLFGNFFETVDGDHYDGVGAFNAETYGGIKRLTGNIIEISELFGTIVGYENHSGQTILCSDDLKPLGNVTLGAGNNDEDLQEGVIYKNTIGTYLHGPILPKNPKIADFLIAKAIENRDGKVPELAPIDDSIAELARIAHLSRPR